MTDVGNLTFDRADDRATLAALVAAYARHADGRDFDALAELFVADGVLAMFNGHPDTTEPLRQRRGRAEIVAALALLGTYTVTHHMLGQHSAWFSATDRARATGETYCIASHVRPAAHDADQQGDKQGTGSNDHSVMRMMAIRYFDDYVVDGGTWRIERRRLAIDWIDEHPMG
ncbi:MAG TPA: nuclear transport factor 2 family protein [Acidimicrobiia bacterium]